MINNLKKYFSKIQVYFYNNEHKAIINLFLATLIIRLLIVLVVYFLNGTNNWTDDWEYLSMGSQIANGNWNPTMEHLPFMQVGPALPLLISFFIKIFGNPYFGIFIYNSIISSLLVPLLFYLGKELFNNRLGWFLAIWALFNIDFFKYNTNLLKESTVFFFLPLTIYFIVKSIKYDRSIRYIIFASLAFIWLIHADERYFFYLPFFSLFFLFSKPFNIYRNIKMIGIWFILVLVLMLPWSIRNYIVFKQVVIISPRTTAFTSKLWGKDIAMLQFNKAQQTINEEEKLNAIKFGKESGIVPIEYEKTEARIRAFINFWQPTYFKATYIQYGFRPQKWSFFHNAVSLLFYGLFLPFYLLGLFKLIKNANLICILIAVIPILQSLIHAYMVWPLERYRAPINFIIVSIAFYYIIELANSKIKQQ